MSDVVTFGIAAIGTALGRKHRVSEWALDYTEDLRRIKTWGFRGFHRAEPEVGLTDLAVEASSAALERSGLDAADIDLVVLAAAGPVEYLYWDAAAAVQGRLGAANAEAALVSHACSAGVMAFDLVAGKLATHPDYHNVLLVAANRVCETYWNRMDSNTSVFSDGAAAAVLQRGRTHCRWLATDTLTDGTLADLLRLEEGGSAGPWHASDSAPVPVASATARLHTFYDGDPGRMQAFSEATVTRTRDVVLRACKRAGVEAADVKRLIHLNDNVIALGAVAKALEIPLSRTNAEIAIEHGHVGCADQLITLDALLTAGDVSAGDVVALTAMGSGMHWSCTLLQV